MIEGIIPSAGKAIKIFVVSPGPINARHFYRRKGHFKDEYVIIGHAKCFSLNLPPGKRSERPLQDPWQRFLGTNRHDLRPILVKPLDAKTTGLPSMAISSPIVDPNVNPRSASSATEYALTESSGSTMRTFRQGRLHFLVCA